MRPMGAGRRVFPTTEKDLPVLEASDLPGQGRGRKRPELNSKVEAGMWGWGRESADGTGPQQVLPCPCSPSLWAPKDAEPDGRRTGCLGG